MKKIFYLVLGLLVSSTTFVASANVYNNGTGLFNSANLCFEIYTPGIPVQYTTLGPDTGQSPMIWQLDSTLLQHCPQGDCTVDVAYSIPNSEGLCSNSPVKFGKLTRSGVDPKNETYTSLSITPASITTTNNIKVNLFSAPMDQFPGAESLQFWLSH